MQVNDWHQVEEIFHSALQLKAEDRAVYLSGACSGDESLRREVESLIEAFEQNDSFIAEPAFSLGMKALSLDDDVSLAGRDIGQYKVLRLLGRGGMGSVYLAEDRKLERNVALKFIARSLVDNEWAKEQLTREARSVAKLEDPNICTVYGIEELDGHDFIVMQYVEGQTLDSLISRGPIRPWQALGIAEQIVSALSAAHARAIIHRDIKPQNIIVKAGGQVKVLDFGLAKPGPQSQAAEDSGRAEQGETAQSGLVVGTVSYMSPEQMEGGELDMRTDIFSFGVVLYEMLSGRNPFRNRHTNGSAEEVLRAIKSAELPPLKRVASGLPTGLYRIARRCLARERGQRYQTADTLLRDLHKLRRAQLLERYALPALAIILLLIATAGFVYLRYNRTHTLAVLPVVNAVGGEDMEALSAGLTKSLAGKLSHLSRLHVRVPTFLDKNQYANPADIGRALQVEAVLVNKIISQDGVPQLQTSLVNVADGVSQWQETVPINLAEIQALQNRLALRTTAELHMWLSRDEERLLLRHQTDNTEALRLYMRGQYLWGMRDKARVKEAIEMFSQATALDPAYAQAWAGLADCYTLQTTVAYGPEPIEVTINKARYAANKALQSDSMLSEAHTALGVIQLRHGWNWAEAEREFRLAIELNRDYSPAHYWYSLLLLTLHRNEEARKEGEIYKALEPFTPMATVNLARPYYRERQYDLAISYLKQVLRDYPNDKAALYILGLAYVKKEMYPEAISALNQLYSVDPVYAAAPLGYAYARTGRTDEALRILDMLDRTPADMPVPAQEKAIIYMGLRDNDKAFAYLEEAYKERFPSLVGLTNDPFFDDLRSDPRFYDLANRMGLTP